jgi:hypothetical protein
MATTTNYSWSTPDDTALVKDGAAAIRSLGTAIDTTVFNNAGAAIAKTLVDAKGDLIVGSAADAVARLAAGTNGYLLSANSGATNGLEWVAAPTAGKVLQVINASYATEVGSSTNAYADTGLTATITPSAATSKVLVLVNQNGVGKLTSDTSVGIKLFRGATEITVIDTVAGNTAGNARNIIGSVSTSYLDSPNTTSATTYKTQFNSNNNSATAYVQFASGKSTITLIEIGA